MLLLLTTFGVMGCKITIEKPHNGDTYTANTDVEFKAEYDGTGDIKNLSQ